MNRSIIYLIVIMAFAFIIGRYKLLPYLAAKKILKESKKNGTPNDVAIPAASGIPSQIAAYQSAVLGGYAPIIAQPQPERPSRRDMYFDYRIINTDVGSAGDIVLVIDGSIADLLATLRNRGICPDSLNIVPIDDGLLLAYVTYTL